MFLQMEGAMRSVLCDDLSASYNSTLGHITKDLEHSLDLQSATSGSRIVTAQEVGNYKISFLIIYNMRKNVDTTDLFISDN